MLNKNSIAAGIHARNRWESRCRIQCSLQRILVAALFVVIVAVKATAENSGFPTCKVAGMCVQPKKWDKAHNFGLLDRYVPPGCRPGCTTARHL